MLLSVFLGNGVQLLLMAVVTLFFACLGFLSPGKLPAGGRLLATVHAVMR